MRHDATVAARPTHAAHAGAAALLTALLLSMPGAAAAASNALSAPAVAPTSGTTSTDFLLGVSYDSAQGFPATSVVAVLASRTVTMALASGTAVHGTYEASTRLPAGRWPVTFVATASQGKSPTIAGLTVVVVGPATATPRPTPAPTPRTTPAPAPPPPVTPASPPAGPVTVASAPTVASTPSASASSMASEVASAATPPAGVVVGTPGGTVVPASAASAPGDESWPLLAAVATIAAGGLGAAWLLASRRGRPATTPAPALSAAATPAPVRPPPRRLADWELAALDDEPIGTVEAYGQRL